MKNLYSIKTVKMKKTNPWMTMATMFRPVMSQLNGSRKRSSPAQNEKGNALFVEVVLYSTDSVLVCCDVSSLM